MPEAAIDATTAAATRAALLIAPTDPIPAGARFVEARYRSPEGAWDVQIPGALPASVDNDVLAAHPKPDTGRFPLPDPGCLAAILDDAGIDADTPVVVYAVDPEEAKVAARAWFVLRHAGVRDVRVLDGGLAAWQARREAADAHAGGGPQADVGASADAGAGGLSTFAADTGPNGSLDFAAVTRADAAGAASVLDQASDAASAPAPVHAIDADGAAEIGRIGRLLDARGASAYIDGHIPGAKCVTGSDVFADGWLLPEDELAAWAQRVTGGTDAPVAAYCGGGIAAAGVVFALATLGIDAGLYVGSWTQWSRLEGRPIER